MDVTAWRIRWAEQRRILANLLTEEKGFENIGQSGYVEKYAKGPYQVWISVGNPDVWIRKGVDTVHNAEGVFSVHDSASGKQVQMYEFLATI